MVDLSVNLAGIKAPSPFWLSSGPVTNTAKQADLAFAAGWGGFVWKTIGTPIINVSSRLGGLNYGARRLVGLNNIELISDRSIEDNVREIADIKRRWPQQAVVASIMAESKKEAWQELVRQVEESGCDGLELNFSCPHGMHERGMGAAVGQVPEYTERTTDWVKSVARTPVIVKLTPNISDIRQPARAAKAGGADGVSLINTISSIIGVDLDRFEPIPSVNGRGTHGGYCGPAVKPIALNMVATLAQDEEFGLPISGIGGITTWRDVLEFMVMGATSTQVHTAVMHWGFRIIEDMIDGVTNYLEDKGFHSIQEIIGKAVPSLTDWGKLDLNYQVRSQIVEAKCIGCQVCFAACRDGGHDSIRLQTGTRVPMVDQETCVGCNLCLLACPVEGAIAMARVDQGKPYMSWEQYVSAAGAQGCRGG
ncbi:MAG: NAD-dependent dihydropyrimidine dehydrogenase subunit PreA [Chloroflexi bacterium]|nr:NAD-dependent dihydropyrimidine dehydrogenase subunit PreA [Chloroflexota bacterium]MCL5107265.1 NAD-dependent dihydropyrimidine dehydrogenase subunit PreA [Chloroflexota bacterium]